MSLNTLNFNRHTWAGGQVITSQLLNRIEAGILDVTNALSTSNTFINGLNYTNNGGNVLKTVTNITQTEGKIAVTYADIQSASTSQKGVTQLSSTIPLLRQYVLMIVMLLLKDSNMHNLLRNLMDKLLLVMLIFLQYLVVLQAMEQMHKN